MTGVLDTKIVLGRHSFNTEKHWNNSFTFLYGNIRGVLKTDENARIIISSNIIKGDVVVSIFDEKDKLITSININNRNDTINNLAINKIYRIKASAKMAQGKFDLMIK